jgi:hypothetical protein
MRGDNMTYKVLCKDDSTIIIKGVKGVNNFYIKGYVTSTDYYSNAQFSMYKYYVRISEDTCGLPEGFKTTVISFNGSLPLKKGEKYVFKRLKFNDKYSNFLFVPNLSLHYLDSDEELQSGAGHVKLTQFF